MAPPAPDPAQAAVLRATALEQHETRAYDRCADLFAQARTLAPEKPTHAYDAACCAAQAGRTDEAFASLTRAVTLGYRYTENIERDKDLDTLRSDQRWPSMVSLVQANLDTWLATLDRELYDIYQADQADRRSKPIDWTVVKPRDEARRARVDEIFATRGAKVSADWYHAAMVYQHGPTIEDTRRAHDYTSRALEIEPVHEPARWLAAATEDRILMREDKPQKWGTQFHKSPDGPWELWPVDPTITDAERAEWNVPPLAAAQRRAEEMNASP